MPTNNITLPGARTRRLAVARKVREFERRRAKYLAKADNLAGAIEAGNAEIGSLDGVIEAFENYLKYKKEKPPRTRASPGRRNAALDEAIINAVTEAGASGLAKNELYDRLDRAGVALPARASFAVHLSFFGRSGHIAARNGRWILKSLAGPLPPPAITQAEHLIAVTPGGLSRAEIERELVALHIPYSAKSLLTQLGARVSKGTLVYRDGRYSPVAKAFA